MSIFSQDSRVSGVLMWLQQDTYSSVWTEKRMTSITTK